MGEQRDYQSLPLAPSSCSSSLRKPGSSNRPVMAWMGCPRMPGSTGINVVSDASSHDFHFSLTVARSFSADLTIDDAPESIGVMRKSVCLRDKPEPFKKSWTRSERSISNHACVWQRCGRKEHLK
jgi:hypothetical protein